MKKAVLVAVAFALVLAACGKEKRSTVDLGGTPSATATSSAEPGASAPAASASAGPVTTSKAASGSTSSGGSTASTPKPAAQGGTNPPKDGSYVYRVDGEGTSPFNPTPQKFTNETRTDKSSHSGNVYTTETTTSIQAGKSTIRARWEATKVSLLSIVIESQIGTLSCDYTPKPVIAHIPAKVETFPQQPLTGNGNACGGTIDISVLRKENAKDASGKTWSTWLFEIKINSKFTYNGQPITNTSDDKRWISPDLGTEIKTDTTSSTQFGANKSNSHTTSVLKSHP
jgi:hypothetical protein